MRQRHPYSERDFSPQKSSRAERGDTEKPLERKKCCPNCKSVLACWPCDACGYTPTPQQLELEQVEAARKLAITEDGTATVKPPESDADRRTKWQKRWANDEEWKRAFCERMLAKHGPVRGRQVYFWFSGKSEWPRNEWLEQAAGAPA